MFDLYGIDDEDRIIIRDGLLRSRWQWQDGWSRSVDPVGVSEFQASARAFLTSMDVWFSATERMRMRARIFDLPEDATHRVVRFALEEQSCPCVIEVVQPHGSLQSVLAEIGTRTNENVATALVGKIELQVHAHDEVSIIKPAALRHWLGVCGLADAAAVVRDSERSTGSA